MEKIKWRTKLIFSSGVIIFAFGVLIIFVLNRIRESTFHHYLTELVLPIEELVTNQIIHNMKSHKPSHFQSILNNFTTSDILKRISVIDDTGKVVFSTDTASINLTLPLNIESHAFNEKDESIFIYDLYETSDIVAIRSAIHNQTYCHKCHDPEKTHLGFIDIRIGTNIEHRITKMLLTYDILRFLIIFIIFHIIIIYSHHRYFQSPFNKIKQKIKDIQAGKFDTPMEITSRGELNFLGKNISQMAESLKKSQEEIKSLHQHEMNRAGQLASVGELAASVAHEIKNPIAGVKNALEIISEEYHDLKNSEILKEMFSQIDRIVKTIQDLMEFSSPVEPVFEPLNIHLTIEQAVSLYKKHFKKEGVKIISEFEKNLPDIYGDNTLLNQVFSNMLLNSFQAMQSKDVREIRIATHYDKDQQLITIEFEDSGVGIPDKSLQDIFKPFYTTKHKGTGLGLSLSHSIILLHNGKISVYSENGIGTKFIISFPSGSKSQIDGDMS
ncbi:MAG: ATP-binding protein [Fidelibacterota bacterium]